MIFISLLIAAAMNACYITWMFNNQDIVFSATHKFKQAIVAPQEKGVKSFFTNTFLFVAPLCFFYLLIFPGGLWKSRNHQTDFSSRFMFRYGLIFILTLLVVVISFKITYVKDRWLQPLLFAAPLIFFSGLDVKTISEKQFKRFLLAAFFAAMSVYIAFTLRVVSAPLSHNYSRLSYPFTSLAKEIRESGFTGGLIISNKRFLAGNMSFQFPGSDAIIPGYNFEQLPYSPNHSMAAVIWKADIFPRLPPQLATFLKNSYNVDPADYLIKYYVQPYKYSDNDTVKLALLQFPLTGLDK